MSSWNDRTSAEITRALRERDVPIPTKTTKQELVQMAQTYLGGDPDHPTSEETTAAIIASLHGDNRDPSRYYCGNISPHAPHSSGTAHCEGVPATREFSPQGEVSDERTVFERVHAVLAALPAIGKDSKAPESMGGYAFRGIEAITAALKPALAAEGVFMVPTVVEREEMARSTRSGSALYVVDLLIRFTFYGVGGDSFDAEMWGEGSDSGDKAVSKAATSAFKSMLAITFCISDAESDTEKHDVPETLQGQQQGPGHRPAPKGRVEQVAGMVKDAGPGAAKWVKDQEFVWPWSVDDCNRIQEKVGRLESMQRVGLTDSDAVSDDEEATQPALAEHDGPAVEDVVLQSEVI